MSGYYQRAIRANCLPIFTIAAFFAFACPGQHINLFANPVRAATRAFGGIPWERAFLAQWKKGNAKAAGCWRGRFRSYNPAAPPGFSPDAVEIGILLLEAESLVRDAPPARP